MLACPGTRCVPDLGAPDPLAPPFDPNAETVTCCFNTGGHAYGGGSVLSAWADGRPLAMWTNGSVRHENRIYQFSFPYVTRHVASHACYGIW